MAQQDGLRFPAGDERLAAERPGSQDLEEIGRDQTRQDVNGISRAGEGVAALGGAHQGQAGEDPVAAAPLLVVLDGDLEQLLRVEPVVAPEGDEPVLAVEGEGPQQDGVHHVEDPVAAPRLSRG